MSTCYKLQERSAVLLVRKMNEHFKLSKTSRNDLESICIVIRSVPAKFGLPRMFRRDQGVDTIVPN